MSTCRGFLTRSKANAPIGSGSSGRLAGGGRGRPASCGGTNLSLLEHGDLIIIQRQILLMLDD